MLEILDAIGINTVVLSKEQTECSTQLTTIFEEAKNTSSPVAIIVKKNTFTEVKDHNPIINKYKMTRKEAIITATSLLPKSSLVVATTGMAGRELFEHRQQTSGDHSMDFLTVGGMGHANQIGLSMALCLPNKKVVCFDGDGALLMHLGSMGLIGQSRAENYIHILLNNGVHGSVGGQPTLGFEIDFVSLAKGFGYRNTALAYDQLGVEKSIEYLLDQPGPSFLEIRVSAKNQKNIGRPTSSPLNNKELFMKNIHGEKE